MIHVIYRMSNSGYNKIKPEYINNINCFKNAMSVFTGSFIKWHVIFDSMTEDQCSEILSHVDDIHNLNLDIIHCNIGNGAGTFNKALDLSLLLNDDDIVYFLENDYVHKPGSDKILTEGIGLGADFVTLYDHPDKYMDNVNPYVEGGGEYTTVFLSESTHWKLTNSTTMTFACNVKTLKTYETIFREYTNDTHPFDFEMWCKLREFGASLISPIPGYSTHGETAWLSPLTNWKNVISNT